MPSKTTIAWTDMTSNPLVARHKVTGQRGWFCTKLSPGCAHCYASTLNEQARFYGTGLAYLPANADKVEWELNGVELDAILKRKTPTRIFMCDMIDLFHETVPVEFIKQMFDVMLGSSRHTFQILTKRPERMCDIVPTIYRQLMFPGVPSNVWLGVSVENQHWADIRIPLLLETPAAVRFLSCEPLLGPIILDDMPNPFSGCLSNPLHTLFGCPECGDQSGQEDNPCSCGEGYYLTVPGIDWVIIGGESGQHMGKPQYRHRWMKREWAQDIVDQCRAAGVPVFFKQGSGLRPGMHEDLLGEIIQEMPHDRD